MKPTQIIRLINKYGLQPASQRELSLFSWSCVALGYTKYLKKLVKFSYEAVGVLGDQLNGYTLFNEQHIINCTGSVVDKNSRQLNQIFFIPAQKIYQQTKKQIAKIESQIETNPIKCLNIIVKIFPTFIGGLAIYNCFWRYLGNTGNTNKIAPKDIRKIARDRELLANPYPQLDKLAERCTKIIGKEHNFDGDLLRFLSCYEMQRYLKNERITKAMFNTLLQRQQGYFYLFIEKDNQEFISADKELLKQIKNAFFTIKEKGLVTIHGHVGYRGKVRGTVYKNTKKLPSKNSILVVSMTHPKDIALIKKCLAIVTDEGGILSHAAIVSRELGLPCVVGTKIATKALKDGDMVEVDANKGMVRKIR